MAEVGERPQYFLGQRNHCMFNPAPAEDSYHIRSPLTLEHLVTRHACKMHPRLLQDDLGDIRARDVLNVPDNLIRLCRTDHDSIDNGPKGKKDIYGKVQAYQLFGLTGLFEFLAIYPRVPDSDLLVLQYHQWKALFTLVDLRFDLLKKQDPSLITDDYIQAHDLIGRYLYRWNKGDFELCKRISLPKRLFFIPPQIQSSISSISV